MLPRLTWYAHRLQAMSLAEVGDRLQKMGRLMTQAGFLRQIAVCDLGPVNAKVPRLPDRAVAPSALRAELVVEAQKLQRGEWQLFGWKDVEVGAPPCWHRDAACGVVIDPDKSAHRLDYRQLPDGADARTIWEINRWAEMTRLAMHGWLNDDADAIRTAQLWLEDWCDRNPPGKGINWTSALEAALRLINFAWFDALVLAWGGGQASSLVERQAALARRIVPVHAAWVWRHLSAGSSANNHLLGELAALVVAVSRWPALEKVACAADIAWEKLGTEVLRQFAEDGGSREQALHYHQFGFELAWHAVRTVGCKAGPVRDRLIAAGRFFHDLAQGGEPWDFGDSDDAQIVPMTQQRSAACAEWLQWLGGAEGSLHYWLGESPLTRRSSHPASAGHDWQVQPESGMAICHSEGWVARLDASPLGFGCLAAHGHCDALHVSIWDDGLALLIDPGTGGYHGHRELRAELAAWDAHNGPQPAAGFQTPQRIGAFLQTAHHPVPALVVEGAVAVAIFTHEGHAFQRRVRLRDCMVEISDAEDTRRPFTVRWCFAPECQVKPITTGEATAFRITRGLRAWELGLEAGDAGIFLDEVRVSSAYGRIQTSTRLVVQDVRTGMVTRLRRL